MLKMLSLMLAISVLLAACTTLPTQRQTQVEMFVHGTVEAVSASPTASMSSQKATRFPPAIPTAVPTAVMPAETELAKTAVAADDNRIVYNGRFDFSETLRPAFDWSGSSIAAAFWGTSLTVFLDDGRNLYNVSVDGKQTILKTETGKTAYIVAENLAPGEHFFTLTKRTEAYVGAAVFSGMEVTGDLLARPVEHDRLLEFIGDSITAGYGNEGEAPECWFTPDTQNAELSYAAIVAEQLGAGHSLIALSGLGVVRNLRDERAASPETAVDYIDRALAMNPAVVWPAERAVPAAVVINLGTNDFSSLPFPDEEDFVDAYVELLASVHDRYSRAHIFALGGPLMQNPAPRLIEQAVMTYRQLQDTDLASYVLIEDNLERSAVDFGCDWHPNVHGHRKIAGQLAPVLAEELGW